MNGCLDDNEASEFASGSLEGSAATRVERHLASCRDCRSLVAALAPHPGDPDADSDVVTSPRRVALGKKRGKGDIAVAPTERPTPPGATAQESTAPGKRRRQDPVIAAGDTVGRYIILARLGAGGMGVVYTAYDPQLDRKIALKLLRTGTGLADAEARSRLIREAQAIAQLSHPNVVAVYDVGTADSGEVYIAMELVEGETLTSWLGHWERSWREILELFFQAGRGLAAAHARGVVHRDFKPDNVLVGTDGRVRVTDFGLARSLIDQVDELARDRPRPDLEALRQTLTATGTVLGTPRYMAPEQLRGADADARSDQFSFCVALYEALYDRHPLPGDSVFDVVQHGAEAEAPPEATKIPAHIGKAIMRGLDAEPNKRFPTLAQLLLEATPPPLHPHRRSWAIAFGAMALVAGGAAAAMVAQRSLREDAVDRADSLQREKERLEKEIAEIRQELSKIIRIAGDQTEQVKKLEEKLAVKEEKVQELEAKLSEVLDAAPVARPRPRVDAGPPPPQGLDDSQFLSGIAAQQARIESCMKEFVERKEGDNATLTITLSVGPDGNVISTRRTGMDPSDQAAKCAERAIEAATFAPTTAVTSGEVTVVVEAGQVRVSPKKTGATAAGQTIDLD
jgi:serine/threonine protein kinase